MQLGCESFVDFVDPATDVVHEVLKTTDGEGAHGVFVTAGSPSAYQSAPKMLRIGGKIMCIGLRTLFFTPSLIEQLLTNFLAPAGSTIAGADPAEFVLRNISITGSMVGGMLATQRCLELAQRVSSLWSP
jgi:propanol-preferring alcohol dehydrogenase